MEPDTGFTRLGIMIGVDVGGTNIRAGAVKPAGEMLGDPVILRTGADDNAAKIYGRITGAIEKVIRSNSLSVEDIAGIGLGVTGPLDTEQGLILECPQLPTMHNFPLRENIREKFGVPVVMNNDANSLVLGESIWGAGKGFNTVLGYTLGTGLGCATVINSVLYNGANGMAGEIWPSPYKDGTIEDVISGKGISSIYFDLTHLSKSADEISRLAGNGDAGAVKTWITFGQTLAVPLAWGINVIDPDIVVLGGSISNALDLFYEPMMALLRKHICPVPASRTRVVKASLGNNAGFMGAAALVIHGN